MTRLPTPGSDQNTWGTILNDYLSVEHNTDGTLKKSDLIADAEQTGRKNQPNGYAGLDTNGKIASAQLGNVTDSTKVSKAGDTMTGNLVIDGSASSRTLTLQSSFAGGEDDAQPGHFDSTARLNLQSYQRASSLSYGETVRNYLMRKDSKAMTAWYGPRALYDSNRNPIGTTWDPWAWTGAHYEANAHDGLHAHWEVEVPDSTGALQGRLLVPFGDRTTGTIGLDKTNITTNLADFTVSASNGQKMRLASGNTNNKDFEFSLDIDGGSSYRRWVLRTTNETESTGNLGSNFALVRYGDDGSFLDSPIIVQRSSGQVTVGGQAGTSAGLLVNRQGNSALTVNQLTASSTNAAVSATAASAATRAYQSDVSGDGQRRYVVFADGKTEWGDGTLSRDTNLYRSSADVLRTDDTLHVGANLRINTTSLGGGSGVFAIANASVVPAATPTGGGVMYVENGALKYRGSSGTVTVLGNA